MTNPVKRVSTIVYTDIDLSHRIKILNLSSGLTIRQFIEEAVKVKVEKDRIKYCKNIEAVNQKQIDDTIEYEEQAEEEIIEELQEWVVYETDENWEVVYEEQIVETEEWVEQST